MALHGVASDGVGSVLMDELELPDSESGESSDDDFMLEEIQGFHGAHFTGKTQRRKRREKREKKRES